MAPGKLKYETSMKKISIVDIMKKIMKNEK